MAGSIRVMSTCGTLREAELLCAEIETEVGRRPSVRRFLGGDEYFTICYRWKRQDEINELVDLFTRAGWENEFIEVKTYGRGRQPE